MSNGWNGSLKSEGQPSVTIDPSTKWYNITSNSIYDIPRLSSNYANVPLHITVPVLTPVHHRRSLIQHDDGLEKRLLNAGLSPETVALYERILRVADRSSIAGLSAMNTLNQYSIRS